MFFEELLNYLFNLKEGGRQLTLRTETDSVPERRSSVLTNRRGVTQANPKPVQTH